MVIELTQMHSQTSESVSRVLARLKNSLSPATWKNRRSALNHALRGAKVSSLEALLGDYPELATRGLLTQLEERMEEGKMGLSTALTHCKNFRSVMSQIPGAPVQDLSVLSAYQRALVRDGANIPRFRPIPLTREVVRHLLRILPTPQAAAVFVAWKTASRWSDVWLLPLPLRYDPSKKQILVSFLSKTKTGVSRPFAPRFLAMIDWNSNDSTPPPPRVLEYLTTHRGPLCQDTPTKDFELVLKTVPADKAPRNLETLLEGQTFRDHYTCHSIKTGAIRLLWEAVMSGELMDYTLIERIGKHQNPKGEILSDETVRYSGDLWPVAIALKTHLVSRML